VTATRLTAYGTDADDERRAALLAGDLPVAVYGLGKMGLPLAAVYAEVTGNVTGVDVEESVAAAVDRGDCPVENEPGLDDLVADLATEGALSATADAAAAADAASVHVLIVPTTVREDGGIDLSNLEAAVRSVGAGLDPGDFVAVESTVPPGTCAEVVEGLLTAESGLDPEAFGLAFCPERTASGRALRDIRGAYPKVVGGVDPASTHTAELVYGAVTDNEVIAVSDARTAECVKLFEGVYRDVNIALANELAQFTDELGVDVNEAIDTANTQPYCDIHTPGPGVGGHCIPYYPQFLVAALGRPAPLIGTARQVNEEMPAFTVRTLQRELGRRGTDLAAATVLLLGVTYRAGVDEIREAPALDIAARLTDLGAAVYAIDPVREDFSAVDATPIEPDDVSSLRLDAVVLVTDHEEFGTFDWDALDPTVVVDGRQTLDLEDTDHCVYTIGGG
jgi:UDP-N-acetyl-D-mannosaminuronic acid dehydrogenase